MINQGGGALVLRIDEVFLGIDEVAGLTPPELTQQ